MFDKMFFFYFKGKYGPSALVVDTNRDIGWLTTTEVYHRVPLWRREYTRYDMIRYVQLTSPLWRQETRNAIYWLVNT